MFEFSPSCTVSLENCGEMNGATNEVIIGNESLHAEPLFDAQTPPLRLEPKELPSRAAMQSEIHFKTSEP